LPQRTPSQDVARAHEGPLVVLTTVSSDSHTWNLVFLELLLGEMGCRVINLGACPPDDLVTEVVADVNPDGVVVSTVNGHGYLDGQRLVRQLRADPARRDVPIVIGGKLDTSGGDEALAAQLVDAGYTAVCQDSVQPLREIVAGLRDSTAQGIEPEQVPA